MIRLLTGQPTLFLPEGVVLDVQGVGYEVFLTLQSSRSIQAEQKVTLHIYTHVKEDALQLFGFLSTEERALFLLLLSVSGVGPKTALGVLNNGSSAVEQAIRQSDVAFFQSVPRLGKKTAQKIIVELQSKVGKENELSLAPESSLQLDLREALLGLGYDERSIASVVQKVDTELSIQQALKWALKTLGSKT